MANAAEVRDYLREAEATQRRLRSLSTEMPEGWKREYVQARQDYRSAMTAACDVAAKRSRGQGQAAADDLARLQKVLFQALDTHQSKWPVVILSAERSASYRQSVAALEEKHDELATFLRRNF